MTPERLKELSQQIRNVNAEAADALLWAAKNKMPSFKECQDAWEDSQKRVYPFLSYYDWLESKLFGDE